MTAEESQLYWEMVRTIKLLGGKSDILGSLAVVNSTMPQNESIDEAYRLVKCWNDSVEGQLENVPESVIYAVLKEAPCE